MLRYVIVILDRAAASFCHYRAERADGLMAVADLRRLVDFAVRNRLALNCLLGQRPLPPEHARVLEGAAHVKLVPCERSSAEPTAVAIVDGPDQAEVLEPLQGGAGAGSAAPSTPIRQGGAGAGSAAPSTPIRQGGAPGRNLILRLGRERLDELAATVETLWSRCRRLNLRLLDVDRYGDAELNRIYPLQLERVVELVRERYSSGDGVEVSFLSDRMLHTRMHNCNAGVEHVTFAPDGRFYICPGFFYDDLGAVGDLERGIEIPNPQLLRLDHAPICSACDAYHCKRCVYLNRRTTGELNTPSRQQCVLAHIERNASARLLASLRHIASFRAMPPLRVTGHLDPITRAARPRPKPSIRVRDGHRLVTLPPLEPVRPRRDL